MKQLTLKTVILSVFFITSISLLLFYFGMKAASLAAIVFLGLACGLFIVVFNGFFVPKIWMYQNRFLMYGFLFGIAIFALNLLTHLSEGEYTTATHLGINLFFSVCLGMLFGAIFLKWKYRFLKNMTPLETHTNEIEIFEDNAVIDNDDLKGRGRMVLTSERLTFIYSDVHKSNFNVFLCEIKSSPALIDRFGFPIGIYFSDRETRILVKFPKLWKIEIQKIIDLNAS